MSKRGREIAIRMIARFHGPKNAAKAVGLEESTLEKWRTEERSPRDSNYDKCLIALQNDDPIEREARILLYTQQIKKYRRIKWKEQAQ